MSMHRVQGKLQTGRRFLGNGRRFLQYRYLTKGLYSVKICK